MKHLTILLCALLAGCSETDPDLDDYRVQRVVLDGKPCIIVSYSTGNMRTTGVDCDWREAEQ